MAKTISPSRSLPLADTATVSPRILEHVGIAVNGEIVFVFPRGTSYAKIKRFSESFEGKVELRLCKVKTTYEVLEENRYYDTSAKVMY